jgi:hypothetical protein
MIRQIKKTTILILTIILLLHFDCFSQDNKQDLSKNSIYGEIFGNAGYLYNLTFDRIVFTKDQKNISIAIGLQYFNSNDIDEPIASISPQINYFIGKNGHHFETGVGVAFDYLNNDYVIPLRVGYRYQKKQGGLFFKIGFTPLIIEDFYFSDSRFTLFPWGGLGIGLTF